MVRSLSNLVNNLSEGVHRIKCNQTFGIKFYDCFLEYTNFKVDLIEYICLSCKKTLSTKV